MFSQWLSEQDELFKFISAPCAQQQTLQQSKLLGDIVNPSHCDVDRKAATTEPKLGRKRKSVAFDHAEESPKDYLKKIIHRDVERQRRQEMAGLYQNLRSLIPSEYLQAKRPISDHIHGTVRYIKHMKDKIDELNKKRKKLKNSLLPNPSSLDVAENPCSEVCEQPIITVKTCRSGIEITVNTGMKGTLSLSKILKVLISEGMSIKSCTSTMVHERQLHIIESEMNEGKTIDPYELHKKLMGIARNKLEHIKLVQT